MQRDYQLDFSSNNPYVFDQENRLRKAKTIARILEIEYPNGLSLCKVVNLGVSSGVIDNYLADRVDLLIGLDIDDSAVEFANKHFSKDNLLFIQGDAMHACIDDASVDIVICTHVYEHVPDAEKLMSEINRILKPEGKCYFAAGNRYQIMEPHYKLPFLSVIPRPMAHLYMKLAGKGDYYHEKHLSLTGLRELTKNFDVRDYSVQVIEAPEKFEATYMLKPKSLKQKIAKFIGRYLYYFMPSYIWVLHKKK